MVMVRRVRGCSIRDGVVEGDAGRRGCAALGVEAEAEEDLRSDVLLRQHGGVLERDRAVRLVQGEGKVDVRPLLEERGAVGAQLIEAYVGDGTVRQVVLQNYLDVDGTSGREGGPLRRCHGEDGEGVSLRPRLGRRVAAAS